MSFEAIFLQKSSLGTVFQLNEFATHFTMGRFKHRLWDCSEKDTQLSYLSD